MTDHIPTCAQLEIRPCFNGLIDHGSTDHRWSGWPGAYCLTCHAEDKNEVCLALSCECPCHAEFWESFARDVANVNGEFEL